VKPNERLSQMMTSAVRKNEAVFPFFVNVRVWSGSKYESGEKKRIVTERLFYNTIKNQLSYSDKNFTELINLFLHNQIILFKHKTSNLEQCPISNQTNSL
jgi:regulatory protein YycI of two-component signal transduction system YycFG